MFFKKDKRIKELERIENAHKAHINGLVGKLEVTLANNEQLKYENKEHIKDANYYKQEYMVIKANNETLESENKRMRKQISKLQKKMNGML